LPVALLLTPKGRAKLAAVLSAAHAASATGLAREVRRNRGLAAANAPSPAEEARLLSTGVAAAGRLEGVTVGTDEGGRFIRGQGMTTIRDAIQIDPVVTWAANDQVFAGTGNPAAINARTGFFWNTRRRGIQGPTFPFNHALVQAFEDGGAVWIVVPRPGTRALEPEPGVLTHRMVKTVPPYLMYARARQGQRPIAREHLKQDIRQAVRRVGLA